MQFKQGTELMERRAFVSRSEDQVVLWVRTTGRLLLFVHFDEAPVEKDYQVLPRAAILWEILI